MCIQEHIIDGHPLSIMYRFLATNSLIASFFKLQPLLLYFACTILIIQCITSLFLHHMLYITYAGKTTPKCHMIFVFLKFSIWLALRDTTPLYRFLATNSLNASFFIWEPLPLYFACTILIIHYNTSLFLHHML